MVDWHGIGEKLLPGAIGFLAGVGVGVVIGKTLLAPAGSTASKSSLTLTPSTIAINQIVQANLSGFTPNAMIHIASWTIQSPNIFTFVEVDWGPASASGTLLYEFQAIQATFPTAGTYPIIAYDNYGGVAIAWLTVG